MLYAAEAHAELTSARWDAGRVRRAIGAIVADADAAYDPEGLWPAHEWDGWQAAVPMKNLYVGAAGVAWALDALRRRGHAETALDLADVAARALESFRREPDFFAGEEPLPEPRDASLLCGLTGVGLVAWRLAPSPALADELLALVRANLVNRANELMWGVAGTLVAARALLEWTGEERWRSAVQESEDALRRARDADGLWTQELYGRRSRSLGPAHGLVGNVAALREPGEAAGLLAEAAVVENGHANWPAALEDGGGFRLQWCHGAPGIVVAASRYLDEELLVAGAQLTWDAGPLGDGKGAGICHGTAGNGYALLKAFERTGDELWLERARAFAVHALEQAQRLPARYSLFTGGAGVALFAADCLDAAARYPVLDGLG